MYFLHTTNNDFNSILETCQRTCFIQWINQSFISPSWQYCAVLMEAYSPNLLTVIAMTQCCCYSIDSTYSTIVILWELPLLPSQHQQDAIILFPCTSFWFEYAIWMPRPVIRVARVGWNIYPCGTPHRKIHMGARLEFQKDEDTSILQLALEEKECDA